jgi:hypothetical protein
MTRSRGGLSRDPTVPDELGDMHGRRGRDLPVRQELRQRMGRTSPPARASTIATATDKAGTADASQRVTLKAHVSRHRPATVRSNLARHATYLAREQASRDGKPGAFFDGQGAVPEARTVLAGWSEDRHHFRIILAPEAGRDLADLPAYARHVMRAAERDLKTALSWVAVSHHNTDHPHVHVVLRGRTRDGQDLVIPRQYLAEGLRRRAEEVATEFLGPRQRSAPENALDGETRASKYTALDRLIDLARDGNRLDLGAARALGSDAGDRDRVAARLVHLERVGLAQRDKGTHWYIDPSFGQALRQWGAQEALMKHLYPALGPEAGRVQALDAGRAPVLGVVVAAGRAGTLRDEWVVVVRDAERQLKAARVADSAESRRITAGSVVELGRVQAGARRLREEIVAVSKRDGSYTPVGHKALLREATPVVADAKSERRVAHATQVLARVAQRPGSGVSRAGTDTYTINPQAFTADRKGPVVSVRVRAAIPLDQQVSANAPTWLDQQVRARTAPSLAHPDIRRAADARREWLITHGYGGLVTRPAKTVPTDHGRARLRTAERLVFAEALARTYPETAWMLGKGSAASGTYLGLVELPSGPRALIKSEGSLHVARVRRAPELAPGTYVRVINTPDRGVELFRQPAPPTRQQALSRGYGLGG